MDQMRRCAAACMAVFGLSSRQVGYLFAVAVCLVANTAFATVDCAALTSSASFQDVAGCIFTDVNFPGLVGGMMQVVVPLLLIVWAVKAGFGIVKRVVMGAMGALRRSA